MDKAESVVLMLSDEENYAICEIIYEHFGMENVIVRLEDRKHTRQIPRSRRACGRSGHGHGQPARSICALPLCRHPAAGHGCRRRVRRVRDAQPGSGTASPSATSISPTMSSSWPSRAEDIACSPMDTRGLKLGTTSRWLVRPTACSKCRCALNRNVARHYVARHLSRSVRTDQYSSSTGGSNQPHHSSSSASVTTNVPGGNAALRLCRRAHSTSRSTSR